MPKRNLQKMLCLYREAIRQAGRNGLSLRLRLFAFLFLFLNAIMLGVLVALFTAGVFQGDLSQHRALLQKELEHFSQSVYQELGTLSAQTSDLAGELSRGLERTLAKQDGSASGLQDRPELLEDLLMEELIPLRGALEKSDASGVFLLLDATVNPALPGGEASRACVYLKNMEPNIVSGAEANLRYLLGPMSIARENDISILPQWQMELDTTKLPFFRQVMNTANGSTLPASRLYRWSGAMNLPGSSERRLLCAAPLVASDGTVMGLCGFEVSEMLFKLTYASGEGGYPYLYASLAPLGKNTLHTSEGLYAGPAPDGGEAVTDMILLGENGSFYGYRQATGGDYAGLHNTVSLYPTDSAYADEQWAAALMLPSPVLGAMLSRQNHRLAVSLLLLMAVDVALAIFLSRRYIKPVMAALEQLKNPACAVKTKIPEIDDLIEFLAAQDAAEAKMPTPTAAAEEHSTLYWEFVRSIELLSKAERRVFDLYIEGHTAQEIADILTVSINTVKTHNRRIYIKLNVTSYKELMIFIEMMKEAEASNAGK